MAQTLKFKRGNNANFSSLTLEAGEPAFILDTGKLYVGNGTNKVMINPDLTVADMPALTLAKISDAGTAAKANTGTASGNVPVLDASGKLNTSVLPAIAITDTFVVATQAAMLALTAEVGDIAIRTDENKSYILKTAGASTLANWQVLLSPTDAVSSVNGKTGAVSLTASDVGAAASVHTHTKAQITDFPASMPASDVSAWAKAASKPTYSATEVGAVPTTRKVNGKELSADITLAAADVGAAVSTHNHDTAYLGISAKAADSAKVNGLTVETAVPSGAKFTDTVYTHLTTDGNLHVPATGTTNSGRVLTAGATAGSLSWTTLSASSVGLGNVTNESKATMFTSAALTGTPTAPTAAAGTNTTQVASTAFVQAAIAVIDGGTF